MSTAGAGRAGFTAAPAGRPWTGRSTSEPAPAPVLVTREDSTARVLNVVTAPVRDRGTALNGDGAVALVPVYRAVQVLTTAAAQLPLVVERAGAALSGAAVPPLVRKPDLTLSRSEWLEQCVQSLVLTGNLFVLRHRDPAGAIVELQVLPPDQVTITEHHEHPRVSQYRLQYHHDGKTYSRNDVDHQALMRHPGKLRGLGPIQAARAELIGAQELRDYSANWFDSTGQPAGILSASGQIGPNDARAMRRAWNQQDPATGEPIAPEDNPTRVRVLGNGADYKPLYLNPEDAQWLEARKFSTTEVARLFGIPSSLMLAPVEGTAMTYQNVESEWISFVRFTLMQYLRKIEEALTALTPLGQVVRFNLEGLLRSDTETRYRSYETGLRAGFLTVNEVRALEGRPPVPGGDVPPAPVATTTTTTTAPREDARA